MPALAEDAAQHFRDGENELAVRDFVADGGGDPGSGLAGAALVAGGAEVAGLAGEGEELLMPALGAMEAGEALSEVGEFLGDRPTVRGDFVLGGLQDENGGRQNIENYSSILF